MKSILLWPLQALCLCVLVVAVVLEWLLPLREGALQRWRK